MKKLIILLAFSLCGGMTSQRCHAQADELAQLLLNLEKLAEFKQILSDLKKGYEILSGGYTTIKNIAEGNFNLHKTFLDGLLEVSPAVRNYKRVADIINYQVQLVREYKAALKRFKGDDNFGSGELEYITGVYSNLFQESLENLDALAIAITTGKARMSDDERIKAIDGIFREMEDKLSFLRWFNNSATVLSLQRSKDKNDTRTMRELFGVR